VNKHFSDWKVGHAFSLEHSTFQFRLADEFELIEAPDILALSNKNKDIGESM